MSAYYDACELLLELDVPDEAVDDIIDNVGLCDGPRCTPYGEGDCCYDTRDALRAEAKKYQDADSSLPPFTPTWTEIGTLALMVAVFVLSGLMAI